MLNNKKINKSKVTKQMVQCILEANDSTPKRVKGGGSWTADKALLTFSLYEVPFKSPDNFVFICISTLHLESNILQHS